MPFQFQPYQSQGAGTIADLILRSGDARAQAMLQAAQIQAQANQVGAQARAGVVGNIAGAVSGSIGDILQQRQQQRQAQAQYEAQAPQREAVALENALREQRLRKGDEPAPPPPTRTRAVKTVGPGGKIVERIVEDTPGQEFEVPPEAPPAPPRVTYGAPTVVMQGGRRVLARPGSDGSMQIIQGMDPEGIKPTELKEPTRLWVQRNGQIIRVAEDQIKPGDTPASTREQGRPVTSGDAGRLSELDSSLDDLSTLRQTIEGVQGATGPSAAIGAALPNVVTNLTGWGTEAKQKQAVIDRVKQVIGKALEEGVLRKEDEAKYAKILPTIGDPPEVVTTKLNGLQRAIEQKRQRDIDALEDANYDVSKFRTRRGVQSSGNGANIGRFTVVIE